MSPSLVGGVHRLQFNIAPDFDPLQERAGRLVVRVLRDEFALEGSLQDALAKAGGSLKVAHQSAAMTWSS